MDYERTSRQGFASSALFTPQRQYDDRDTSSPMDVDRPSYWQGETDSPPRKRPHIDPTPREPIFPPSSQRHAPAYPAPFGQQPPPPVVANAPWLFDTDRVRFAPGAATPVEEVRDVEMSSWEGEEGEETEKEPSAPAKVPEKAKEKEKVKEKRKSKREKEREEPEDISTELEVDELQVKGREVALGGYKRVMKRRRQQALTHADQHLNGPLQPSLTQQIFWPYPVPSGPHQHLPEPDYATRVWAWCRAVFNSLLLLFVFLSAAALLYFVFRDVGSRIEHHNREYSIEVQECIDKRIRNHCDSEYVGPELRLQCLQWENCIRRDTRSLGYTKVIAQVLAEVLDEFANNVSWRMAMFLTATAVILIAANFKPFPAPPSHPHTDPPAQAQPSHTPNFQFVPPSAPFPFPPIQHHPHPQTSYDAGEPRIEELDDEPSMDSTDGRVKLLEGANGRKW
ncbi:hypothetical protein CALCODRAFT_379333 [Calocera cornea HHB12733]|uniref:Brl1/Brr6 domain-containing protein n=1 Tax=Calocera cornea HHB12733 TaxID=1353952 RepID=A0A165EDR4_9BASI|nr:hypothetical protein CALCODRAFT_379333 [Calocera cornea HHB12733]